MDTTHYLIIILSPIVVLLTKLSIKYTIIHNILRRKHSKTFLKKNRGNIVEEYFCLKYKNEIGLWFYLNFSAGLLLFLEILLALVYSFLWAAGHTLKLVIIPYIVIIVDLTLVYIRFIRQIIDKILKKQL